MKIKPILNIALLTAVGTSSTVSCTWRDAGCMLGAAAAGTAAYVICENLSLSSSETAIYVGIASMPDKHGYVSLSLSNTYEMAYMN